jgi:hypothetical protein
MRVLIAMTSFLRFKDLISPGIRTGLSTVLLGLLLVSEAVPQCVRHPKNLTALRFSNESRADLIFYIDDDEEGIPIPSLYRSREFRVEPGEHLLKAKAVLQGMDVWVWTVNEVPRGQVCTWTVADPERDRKETGKVKYPKMPQSRLGEPYE